MHKMLLTILAFFARQIIKFKKPYIIGVTGSVGKTTISRFVVQFLQKEFGKKEVQFSHHNYNGEYGLPLTIIGAESGERNIFRWFLVFVKFIKTLFLKYPKYAVLEYGIDHPGEMDFLLSIAVPDVAIIGKIAGNHLEQFGNFETYQNEKLKILQSSQIIAHKSLEDTIELLKIGENKNILFYNGDEKNISKNTPYSIRNVSISLQGTSAEIFSEKKIFSVQLPMFGKYQIENLLPLFCLADILNISKEKLQEYISDFIVDSSRSMILSGVKNSIIIDGSYNGSTLSIMEGLQSIRNFIDDYNIIILLGDMRELGDFETQKHEELVQKIIDFFSEREVSFFLVGKLMRKIVAPILGEKYHVFSSLDSRECGRKIRENIENSEKISLVFSKGSQNTIFLEEGVKEIISKNDYKYLCRQEKKWLKIKQKYYASLGE